ACRIARRGPSSGENRAPIVSQTQQRCNRRGDETSEGRGSLEWVPAVAEAASFGGKLAACPTTPRIDLEEKGAPRVLLRTRGALWVGLDPLHAGGRQVTNIELNISQRKVSIVQTRHIHHEAS